MDQFLYIKIQPKTIEVYCFRLNINISKLVYCLTIFIYIIFMPGSTEREILKNFEEIVETSLPLEKLKAYYEECAGSAKQVVLSYVTFFEQRKSVSTNM